MVSEKCYCYCSCPPGIYPEVRLLGTHTFAVESPKRDAYQRPEWIIDCSPEGGCRYRINDEKTFHTRRPHDVYIYSSDAVRLEDSPEPARSHTAFIIFTGGELLGFNQLLNTDGYAVVRDQEQLAGKVLFAAPTQCLVAGTGNWMAARETLYKIAQLLRLAAPLPHPGRWKLAANDVATIRERVGMLERRLRSHAASGITLNQLASEMSCSVTTLNTRYRKLTGRSVGQALLNIRVEMVCTALSSGRPLA